MARVPRPFWRQITITLLIGLGVALIGVRRPAFSAFNQGNLTPTVKICHLCDDEIPGVTSSPAFTPSPQGQARVRLVMFWMNGCPHCHEVLEKILPPLQQRYGNALDIRQIEIATVEDVNYFYQVAEYYGIPREQAGVPFLIVGNRVLKGSGDIAVELPPLIEELLAQGGNDWPVLPASPSYAITPEITPTKSSPIPTPIENLEFTGFGFLYAVIAFLIVSILYAVVSVIKVVLVRPNSVPSMSIERPTVAIFLLALIGLGIAVYLSVVEISGRAAWCGPVGDCNAVQSSAYARLGGVVPIALIGVIGYAMLLVLWGWGRYGRSRLVVLATLGIMGLALVGTAVSLYLAYLEVMVIRAMCGWCTASALTMGLLLWLSVPGAQRAWKYLLAPNLS